MDASGRSSAGRSMSRVGVIVLHNLGEHEASVQASVLDVLHGRELLSDQVYGPLASLDDDLGINPLDYRWITGEVAG